MMRILLALLGLYSFVQGTPWSPLKPTIRNSESTTFTTALTSPPTTPQTATLESYPSEDKLRILRRLSEKLCEDEEKCLDIFIDLLNDRKPKDELIALLKNNRAYQKSLQTHKSYREFMEKVRQSKGKISETAKVVWRIVKEKLESSEVIKGNVAHYTYKYIDYFLDVLMRLPILFDKYDQGPKHGLFMTKLGFAVDRGGTFTDVCVFYPERKTRVLKLLSEDPSNYKDAPTEAIRRVIEEEFKKEIPKGTPIPTDNIAWIRMGTTVATNALLERKGEPTALLITKGFKDLLFIGNQSRPKIFDFDIKIPEVLYKEVIEIDERVIADNKSCQLDNRGTEDVANNGQKMFIEKSINDEEVTMALQSIKEKGIRSIAVLFLHSYIYPNHELKVKKLAEKVGFCNISLSHEVMPMIKAVPRGFTVCADAYLTPKIEDYIRGFSTGFADKIQGVTVNFMQSDGGLCDVNKFCGSRAILSGPAGGVVGIARTTYDKKEGKAVIGFDMGGTSTDVCRYSGELEHVMETTTAGVTIQAPQLDIHTVAAGGGSRLFFRNGLFVVGPESAGAHPGPICYKKNGFLAVTDANLVLGRILPDYFPHIFGEKANEPLDKDSALTAMKEFTDEINEYVKANPEAHQKKYTVEEVALGFVSVANEEMCRPIRALTQAKGYDTSDHVLACFGGAGGQHACAVAQTLGIREVFVHKYSGVLSAYGIALADVVAEAQEPAQKTFTKENFSFFAERFQKLREKTTRSLNEQGFQDSDIVPEYFLHMRYARTDCAIMTNADFEAQDPDTIEKFMENFRDTYRREFGFVLDSREVIVDDIRIRNIGRSDIKVNESIDNADDPKNPPVEDTRICYFEEGALETQLYQLTALKGGHLISGPALIIDANSTIVIEPKCTAEITEEGNVKIHVASKIDNKAGTQVDPIRLAIFSNRFMSIAEQMGRVLQRTAISTNIKERLDFSCALFGPDGGLIANAPHIPVHLGGMQYAVKYQIDSLGMDNIHDGDVILSNHPKAGGSHLPDLTVITPVFFTDSPHPVFFLANRGHHADIGGLVPGSMPPNATHLSQEGAAFVSFKIVDRGQFQEEQLIEQLNAPGKIEGCSGTRQLNDNISDLKAQIAANNKGIQLVCGLIKEYGLEVVQAYMLHIQNTAEESVRDLLKKVGQEVFDSTGSSRISAEDFMDDGTPIKLTVDIDIEKGEAVFDFTGTGPECLWSTNAPRAVTMSAVTYCLRCLVARDIPLNNGCLAPVKIVIPPHSLLSPSDTAPVVAGNVLTSQRLCDVVFKAFQAVAASQGCMNNVTFGDTEFGYYETVAGGSGAGNGFSGRSGVHTHMTNTRITDPEILESRYPVILREFSLRPHSGGRGQWNGGDGVVRRMQFRKPLSLSLLTERRSFAPYGMNGGGPGQRGLNLLNRNGRTMNIGNKTTLDVQTGDTLEVHTPGGGGYGEEK